MEHTIDAQNKKLGRLATEIAVLLMGKNRADFARNKIPEIKVKIVNAGKIFVTQKKQESETYKRYSGYSSGLKEPTMRKVIANKGMREVLRVAVKGMLPKNKLRDRMMQNLIITD
jgi:large subunit ribosomal protein L13